MEFICRTVIEGPAIANVTSDGGTGLTGLDAVLAQPSPPDTSDGQ